MFNIFKKKPPKHVFRVRYVLGSFIDPKEGKVTFNLDEMQEAFVLASHLMEAQRVFASRHMLTPHIYVHDIKQIDMDIETNA